MEDQEQFEANRYVEIFRQHYAGRVNELTAQIEGKLESVVSSKEAFRILEAVDKIALEIPNAKILNRYFPQEKTPENKGPFQVDYCQDYQNVGEALRDFRKQVGLTITKLAEISGVSIRSIVDTEASRTTPRKQNLVKYLSCFDVQPTKALRDFWQLWKNQNSK